MRSLPSHVIAGCLISLAVLSADRALGQCETYLEAMIENESGYVDFQADVQRVYETCAVGHPPNANLVTGVYTKKGRDKIHIQEVADLPVFNRQIVVSGQCSSTTLPETKQVHLEWLDYSIADVMNPSNYTCTLESTTKEGLGVILLTPLPGTYGAKIISSIRRWVDPANGVSHRSEVYATNGTLRVERNNSNVQTVGPGSSMAMHQQQIIYLDDTGRYVQTTTDFSNVQLNTGVSDELFVCAGPPIPTIGESGLVVLALGLLCAGIYLFGRRRLRAAAGGDPIPPQHTG